MDALYQGGADPQIVLQDLLDLTHFVTRLKLAPDAGAGDPLEEGDRERARPLADALSMPVLARAWQMLLKGIEEVQAAPVPAQAAAMVLIRLAYVADLPVPADLVRAADAAGCRNSAAEFQPPWFQPRRPRRRRLPLPRGGEGRGEGASDRTVAGILTRLRPTTGRATLSRGAGEGLRRLVRRPGTPMRRYAWSRPPRPHSTRRRKASTKSSRCSTGGGRCCCVRIWSRTSTLSRSSPAGSSSAPPRARRATWRTVSASCSASGPECAGSSPFRRQPARRPWQRRRRSGTACCGTRWRPTRWSVRCSRLSRGRRSLPCGTGSRRPIPAPTRPRRMRSRGR